MRWLVAAIGLAACGPSGDPLNIHYELSDGPTQSCGTRLACEDIPMTCQSVFSIKFVDPDDADKVYGQQCEELSLTAPIGQLPNLCALNRIALDTSIQFPTSRVEVQVAVYPRDYPDGSRLPSDPMTGDPICPPKINFAANGYPLEVASKGEPYPVALGGRGYTDGYASEISIDLGCTDTSLIDNVQCRNENTVDITASVVNFDTRLLVHDEATNLTVRVGEPQIQGSSWVLLASAMRDLELIRLDPEAAWQGDNVDIVFADRACIQALYDQPGATAALACRTVEDGSPLVDLTGVYVRQSTLLEILAAMRLTLFPEQGLVLGMVVDELGQPVSNVEVMPTMGTVKYLSADRTTTNNVATTTTGIFMSRDAPFDAGWSLRNHTTMQAINTTTPPVGGLVVGRLTVMIVQADLLGS